MASLRSISLIAGIFGLTVISCGSKVSKNYPVLGAELSLDGRQVFLVLRNYSTSEFYICKQNVYDDAGCLAVRRYPDTAELPPETVFGRRAIPAARPFITVSDYVPISPGQQVKLPVGMQCIRTTRELGDSVFLAVFFKNIDPFSCSKVEVNKYDKVTQDYCRQLHFIPAQSLTYWSGEVRTPYLRISPREYAPPPRPKLRKPARTKEIIVRKSRTHPLKKSVF